MESQAKQSKSAWSVPTLHLQVGLFGLLVLWLLGLNLGLIAPRLAAAALSVVMLLELLLILIRLDRISREKRAELSPMQKLILRCAAESPVQFLEPAVVDLLIEGGAERHKTFHQDAAGAFMVESAFVASSVGHGYLLAERNPLPLTDAEKLRHLPCLPVAAAEPNTPKPEA